MYFITTKRMLEVCFSVHPNIQYRTVFYIISAASILVPLLLPEVHIFDKLFIGLNHISLLLGYRLAKVPPLFFVSAAGIFLGMKGDRR